MQIDLSKPGALALALLDAVLTMSDEAEALGGATSIAGVASLHKMQQSLQKNKARVRASLEEAARNAS